MSSQKAEDSDQTSSSTTAQGGVAGHEKSTIDWTSIFPPSKIKMVLQDNPKTGTLSQETVDLISTASALFVRTIVHHASSAAANKEILTLRDIRKVVNLSSRNGGQQDGINDFTTTTCSCIKLVARAAVLDGIQESDTLVGKRKRAPSQAAKAKRTKSAVTNSEDLDNAVRLAESQKKPMDLPLNQEICPDEEDYD